MIAYSVVLRDTSNKIELAAQLRTTYVVQWSWRICRFGADKIGAAQLYKIETTICTNVGVEPTLAFCI